MSEVFVLMPFADEFDDVFMVVKDAVAESGQSIPVELSAYRADDIAEPGRITDQVLDAIKSADLVVADLTGNNPNVMYELGYAHALGKRTVITNQSLDKVPFDVHGWRQIVYERTKLGKELRPLLAAAITDVFGDLPPPPDDQDNEDRDEQRPSGDGGGPPLRVGSRLLRKVSQIDLKLQAAGHDRRLGAELASELKSLLDRVTIATAGDPDEARAIAGTVGNSAVRLERMELLEEAEPLYRRALGLFPDYAGLHFQYGDMLADDDRIADAQRELERGRELDPTDRRIKPLTLKIALKRGGGDAGPILDDIGSSLQDDFKRDPTNEAKAVAYLVYLDRTDAPLSEFQAACRLWEESLEDEEAKLVPRRALADKLAKSDRPEDEDRALELYGQLLESITGEERAHILHNVASVHASQGALSEARENWIDAYCRNPRLPSIQTSFSRFLMKHGEPELALLVVEGKPIPDCE